MTPRSTTPPRSTFTPRNPGTGRTFPGAANDGLGSRAPDPGSKYGGRAPTTGRNPSVLTPGFGSRTDVGGTRSGGDYGSRGAGIGNSYNPGISNRASGRNDLGARPSYPDLGARSKLLPDGFSAKSPRYPSVGDGRASTPGSRAGDPGNRASGTFSNRDVVSDPGRPASGSRGDSGARTGGTKDLFTGDGKGSRTGGGLDARPATSDSPRTKVGVRDTPYGKQGYPGSVTSTGSTRSDPATFVDGYGGAQASYYWDGDQYWVGYQDGYHDGFGDGYDTGWSDRGYYDHPYHRYNHHRGWSYYFHYSGYYGCSSYPWYDYWYDPGWSWYDGASLWYHDNHFGLFFNIGLGGSRYYCAPSAFYYRYPYHHRASFYYSYIGGLGYDYGYYSYVPRFGHFGFWDYYPRTTIVYQSYIPTSAPVEREGEPEPVDGQKIDELVMKAEAAFVARDYEEAIRLLNEALALAPDSSQLHLAMGIAQGAAGHYDLAAGAIRRGINLSGSEDPVVTDLRTLYADDLLLAQHLKAMGDQVRATPGDDDVRLVEAYFLLGADRAQAARAAMDTLLARTPDDPTHRRLGQAADERVRLGLTGNEPTGDTGGAGTQPVAPQQPATQPGGGNHQQGGPAQPGEDPFDREYEPPPPRWF